MSQTPSSSSVKGRINVILHNKPNKMEEETFFHSEEEREKHYVLEKMERELKKYVGLDEVKRLIKEVYAWIYINQCRTEQGLRASKQALHMIFKGNPGTGKTTVARLIARFFRDMNVLSKGQLIEAERADLVGEYIGHTAQKTRELIKKAQGGVLFVDEAYSLARGGEKDFGKEAIDTLVKAMEDQQHEFVLILAGYSDEMDYFLSLNPGLPSRFPIAMDFPNYTTDQLMQIVKNMVKEREYQLTKRAQHLIREHVTKVRQYEGRTFSNGRYIRNMIEEAIRRQAVRLLQEGSYSREALLLLKAEDFHFESSNVKP
ncbi:stage V sporulation protein K [Halalkalibacterium halodurans]|uniref:Stage V sporulation protein K n=1 Tax=Halalkalibacterium halodurans (strain ATCC BAA-125 / DSM 18197 / FERM 7344 / JCM 9153 / C-125) TaxID=272558 RepID=Q9KAC6_HALH5|nr:stage V sporulation protein K [Halalkalibacterium halodurans]MED4081191.1 stage V sporulation protein K [Halalkalibacterium halodurans]MED4087026.1 stage V sporulation protein K [Halalkalibacterium halodurans]MED4103192.1 stage V sporulation protein K [Halalkalibacterium halodurans]MED4111054.1 stage V sporulation protein K [Halalkalibacterium halodurans]MED4126190.1 stage V sporulation protein K [Halalkalibacterium halodurans]